MNLKQSHAWAEIDLDAIESNFYAIRRAVPSDSALLAVIKADAYGHGAVQTAQALEGLADFFAVAIPEEAFELRMSGITTPIMTLGHSSPFYFPHLLRYDIHPAILSLEDAIELNELAKGENKIAYIHIPVDTGMSRLGFSCSRESAEKIAQINALSHIEIEGIFSHFANADVSDLSYTQLQLSRFSEFLGTLAELGVNPKYRHICNSAGLLALDTHFDMCRAGIILYGLHPSDETDLSKVPNLKPVMSFRSHIVHIQTLEEGTPISYNCTYTTTRRTRVAVVSAGYADGYPRSLSNRWKVLVNGVESPILGRVCMDQFMIDITDIPTAEIGSVVTLFGEDNGAILDADQTATAAGTIGYELTCGISKRVPRVFLRDGQPQSVHYLLPSI